MEDLNKITYFARTNTRGRDTPFGIKRKDRARHMYVIGKTGMGKSTLLENMAIQDIRNGEGMAFIDPHGATAERLLEYVPAHRVKDVIYFAPFDMDFPVAFNVMEDVGYDKRHLVVSGLLSAFRKIWVDAWSARMEYILSNTLLALLEYPDSTLLDVNRMLVDKKFRDKVVGYYRDTYDGNGKKAGKEWIAGTVKDPIVLSFWRDEFAGYTDRYTQEATPAIQNKIGQFTSNPLIRNIVGQPKSSFDMRKMMDEKKILIMNLSKGRVGEVNATLLGSMLVTKLYLSAMSRADVSASVLDTLPNFYFYVDEFQNFANQSFADILSEARKYKLNLLIAHQYVEQMEEDVRNAVFGNVGTTVAFRVGPFDAETLETIFQPQFTQEDLVNLGFAQIYLTLMIDGVGSPPFSAETLPPFDPSPQNLSEEVKESSRAQFGKLRDAVEGAIAVRQAPEPLSASAPRSEFARTNSGPREHEDAARPPAGRAGPPRPQYTEQRSMPRENRNDTPRGSEQHAPQQATHRSFDSQQHNTYPSRDSQNQRHEERHHTERPNGSVNRDGAITAPPGIHSLREAIVQAIGAQALEPKEKEPHAPDLKATLKALAPQAEAALTPEPPPAPKAAEPAGLPEEDLRKMIEVDSFDAKEQ